VRTFYPAQRAVLIKLDALVVGHVAEAVVPVTALAGPGELGDRRVATVRTHHESSVQLGFAPRAIADDHAPY
jgi:hypothetical protein